MFFLILLCGEQMGFLQYTHMECEAETPLGVGPNTTKVKPKTLKHCHVLILQALNINLDNVGSSRKNRRELDCTISIL